MPLARLVQTIDGVRASYDNLSERERRLVGLMLGMAALLLVGLPLFLGWSAMAELQDENEAIHAILDDFRSSGPAIAERIAARKAAEKLYTTEVPALSTFLEAKAKEAGYDRPVQMTEEPEKVEGGFRRMHTRASFSGVGLVPFLRMLAAIKNSPYPIAIERVQVEHYQKGDKYNVEVGVYAFELTEGGSRGGESKPKPAKSDEDEVLE